MSLNHAKISQLRMNTARFHHLYQGRTKAVTRSIFRSKPQHLPNQHLTPHTTTNRLLSFNGWSKHSTNTITKVVSEAERIVGFPTSFLNLRALLSEELSAVALHLRKLVRTKHPLLKTARGILFDSKHNVQTRGLIVLLYSKSIAHHRTASMNCNDIYSSQRSLAELTELIHTAFLVHRGLIDVDILVKIDEKNLRSEMELGNKMAVLSGDFLLANACVALSELKNSKVVEMMSSAIEDLSHGFFVLPESGDSPHISLDDLPTSRVQWEDLIFLAQGSLVANACAAAVELANQTTEFGKSALNFGKHFMLVQQARLDIERLCHRNIENNNGHFNHSCSEICSLPVVLLAQLYGGSNWLNSFIKTDDITNTKIVMKDELQSIVRQHPSVLEESEEICRHHHDLALSMLNLLPPGEPTESLKLLTKAVSGS